MVRPAVAQEPEPTQPVGAHGLRALVTHQWWLASCLGSHVRGDWDTVDDITLGQVLDDGLAESREGHSPTSGTHRSAEV